MAANLTHPEFQISGSFAHLALGKQPPKHDVRTLQLAKYLDADAVLPTVPAKADWTLGVRSWPMYGNDRYGDCTIAAAGHMIEAWTFAAGHPFVPADKSILNAYWATGDHLDTGRYELDVLNYWRHTGIGGDRIAAYVSVDPADVKMVKAAIYLFGGVYTGIALPLTAQTQPRWRLVGDGKTGDSAPGSWGGHAVPYHAYNRFGFKCVTWGGVLGVGTGFHRAYADECYAVLSADWLNASKESPAGLNLAALTADLGLL